MDKQKVNRIVNLLGELNEKELAEIVVILQDKYGLSYNDGKLYTKEELR